MFNVANTRGFAEIPFASTQHWFTLQRQRFAGMFLYADLADSVGPDGRPAPWGNRSSSSHVAQPQAMWMVGGDWNHGIL